MKRVRRILVLILLAGLIAGAAVVLVVGSGRRTAFDAQVASLQRTWASDVAGGVPEASLAPLRNQLQRQRPQDQWWAPLWWTTDGSGLLSVLRSGTTAALEAAMAAERAKAQVVVSAWQQEVSQNQRWIPASEVAAGQSWAAQLASASTPDQVASLAAAWQGQLDSARTQVTAAQQQARIQADLAAVGESSGLIAEAQSALSTAKNDNLDPGDVASLLSQLQGEVSSGADLTQTSAQLYAALQQVDKVFGLNDQLNGEMRPLLLSADQAAAEGTPNAPTLLSQYTALLQAFHAAATYDQLSPLQATASSLQSAIQGELSASQCGHSVGSGKVITVSITLQEAVFYDSGCVVNATPVTTGRPGFETPTGSFHVFYKTTPFQMISEYPRGSPGWYPNTWVKWVMEFQTNGYFIHDAFWEDQNAFGPGSQYAVADDYASHGCIHIPTALMGWLYAWTPTGTPVIVSP